MIYTFEVDGKEVSISSKDLLVTDTDVTRSSSDIAFWGQVVAALRNKLSVSEAEYRQWSAKCYSKILDVDPKLAEWKVKARVESLSGFIEHKKAIAGHQKSYDTSKSVFDAIVQKASSKQSMLKAKISEAPYVGGLDNISTRQSKVEAYKKARKGR